MATAPARGRRLSADEIAEVAYLAGFRGDALVTAVAVALAESGGSSGAHNPNGEDSRGLWQINVAPNVRPNKWGDLYDPLTNAKAAFEVSGGGKNFNPWTTFAGSTAAGRASSHASHLPAARSAAAAVSTKGMTADAAERWTLNHQGLTPDGVTGMAEGEAAPAQLGSQQDRLPPDADPAEVEAFVRTNYPGAAYLLTASDETKMLVVHAAQEGWSADRLKGAIEKSQWYKTQADSERQWRETVATDPATAEQRRSQRRADITDQAARLGANLKPDQLAMVVEGSLRFGWSQQQLTDVLAGFVSTKKPTGDARTTLQTLRAMAADYAVPVDQKTLQFWVDKILRGEQDEDDFTGFLRGQAIGLFRGNDAVVKQIEAGFNVRQIASGALGWAARELDIADPSTLDLSDPKWLRLIHHGDQEKGAFGPMSGADVIRTVRTDPVYGYDTTLSGRSRAVELRNGIEEMFGVSA